MLGTKQTGVLKQQDASKRYENYLDNRIHLAVYLILIEPFLNTIMGATLEKFIMRRGRSGKPYKFSHKQLYPPTPYFKKTRSDIFRLLVKVYEYL